MKPTKPFKLQEYHLGIFGFLVLVILSVVFYKERVCFIDSAFQFFKIVNFERFNVELNRYTAYIAQIPLLLAVKSGAGLKFLALVFSTGYILLYFVVFLICLYPLKNKPASLVVLFVLIICSGLTFFHITTETHLALVFSVLFYAWIEYDLKKSQPLIKYTLISGLIILLTVFSHPVSIFTLAFAVFYHFITDKSRPSLPKLLFISVFTAAVYVFKMLLLKEHTYEKSFLAGIGFENLSGRLTEIKSLEFFIFNVHRIYLLIILMGIALTLFYFRQRNYRKWVWLAGFYVLFFVISIFIYHQDDSRVMHERSFMPFALLVSIPFVTDVLPALKPGYRLLIIILILGKSFMTISGKGAWLHQRTAYIENMIYQNRKAGIQKSIAAKSSFDNEAINVPWALPFESLILSSMDGKSCTIVTEQDWVKNIALNETGSLFLGASFWPVWKVEDLNEKYFRFDKTDYRLVRYDE